MAMTIRELMERMPGAFLPEKAEGVEAVLQFKFSGAEESNWIVSIKDGVCTTEEGIAENPNMTLSTDSQDYLDIIMGTADPMKSFMEGKLKLAGDLNFAMKLTTFWKIG
jgi:putative sterol carrier protein